MKLLLSLFFIIYYYHSCVNLSLTTSLDNNRNTNIGKKLIILQKYVIEHKNINISLI